MEERQAKDGTFYKKVGPDDWKIVTRESEAGVIFDKIGADEWRPSRQQSKEPRRVEAAISGAAKSMSLGYDSDWYANIKGLEEKILALFQDREVDPKVKEKAMLDYNMRAKSLSEQHPNYTMGGQIAGYAVPGSAIGKGAQAVRGAIGLAPRAATLAGKMGTLAGEGAAIGFAEKPVGDGGIQSRLESAGEQALFGAFMPAAFKATGAVLKTAAKAPKKLLSAFGGVNEEAITAFLKNPNRYLNAAPRDEVVHTIQGFVDELQTLVKSGKMTLKDAKKGLGSASQRIREGASEGHKIARENLSKAEQGLKEAFGDIKQAHKEFPPPTNIAGEVDESIRALKQQQGEASRESFNILDDITSQSEKGASKGGSINVKTVLQKINTKIKSLSERTSKDANAAAKALTKYKEAIVKKSDNNKLNADDTKKLIQDLDADVSSWDSQKIAGSFDDSYNRELKGTRRLLDTELKKKFPAYKEKMSEISKRAGLLSESSKRFGDPQRLINKLQTIHKSTGTIDRDILKQLGKATGKDFVSSVDEFSRIKKALESPKAMERLKRALPEYKKVKAEKALEIIADKKKLPKAFRNALNDSVESKNYKSAIKQLELAQKDVDKIKGWTRQTTESKINSAIRNKGIAREQLETLGNMKDKDLLKMVDDLKINDAFNKQFRIGSRNVNLFTAVSVGIMGYGVTGLIGGAIVGGLVDMYGPRMTKSILKAVARVKGTPTIKKLMSFKLPKAVASKLVDDFYGSVLVASGDYSKREKMRKQKGSDKWAYRGYEKLKHEFVINGKEKLMGPYENIKDPKVKRLLVQASSFDPGTVGFNNIMDKIDTILKEGK